MDGKDICDYITDLASQKGATFAEARFEQLQNNQFVIKNGIAEIGAFARQTGIGLRVLVDGAMGFASFNKLTKETAIESLVEAIKIARASARVRKFPIKFSEEKVYEEKYSTNATKPPGDIHPEEKMEILFDVDKSISSLPIPFRYIFLNDAERRIYTRNSQGSRIESYKPTIMFVGLVTAIDKTRGAMEQAYYQKGATGGYEWVEKWQLFDFLKEQAIELARVTMEAKNYPKGTIDFVVGSQVGGIIAHENCGHPSEADRILGREAAQAGESYLSHDKLGEQIGSEYVTIIDDPTIPGSYGWYLYDEECVPARSRYLIKNGIFTEMLHNRESAGFLDTQSTGAARAAAFNREPIPRMANTYIDAGDYDFDEIFEDIKLGIYMKTFHEWNIDDRRFQSKYVGRIAYLIENGELTDQLVRRPPLKLPHLIYSVQLMLPQKILNLMLLHVGKEIQLRLYQFGMEVQKEHEFVIFW